MLYVLSMLSNQGRTKLLKMFPELRHDLRADEVLNRLFGCGIRINIYLELWNLSVPSLRAVEIGIDENVRHTHRLPYRERLPGL